MQASDSGFPICSKQSFRRRTQCLQPGFSQIHRFFLFFVFLLSILSETALIFHSTAFKTQNPIRQFLPPRAIRTRRTYFVATIFITQCASLRYLSSYQHLWRQAVFQTEKSYYGKTVKCAIFPGFCTRMLQTFYEIVRLVFFCIFYFLQWT